MQEKMWKFTIPRTNSYQVHWRPPSHQALSSQMEKGNCDNPLPDSQMYLPLSYDIDVSVSRSQNIPGLPYPYLGYIEL